MTNRLNESAIETLAIELLQRQGYTHLHALAPDSPTPERSRYEEVILAARLEAALRRINPNTSPDKLQTALKDVQRISSPDLPANNEAFHRLLTEGVNMGYG